MHNSSRLGLVLASLTMVASTALASPPTNAPLPNPKATNLPAAGVSASFGTRARLAITYREGRGVIRSKGVAGAYSPTLGTHCIVPSVPLNLEGIFPSVSIEWASSFLFDLVAYWVDTTDYTDCAPGELSVKTYDFANNPSDRVAFTLTIQ